MQSENKRKQAMIYIRACGWELGKPVDQQEWVEDHWLWQHPDQQPGLKHQDQKITKKIDLESVAGIMASSF